MRRLALIALTVCTVAPASACRDLTSTEPLPIQGSFNVHEAVPAGGGRDLLAEGWQIGITFVSEVYLIVRLPPPDLFAEPEISLGVFSGRDGIISFRVGEDTLDVAELSVEGDDVLRIDFERGGFGFAQMRGRVGDLGVGTTLTGTYEATEFVLLRDDGQRIDLLSDPSASVTLSLGLEDIVPPWGGYQVRVEAPAGVFADTAVTIDYPAPDETGQTGFSTFVGVGQSIVFFDLMGCDPFAGGQVSLSGSIAFQGYACDIAGESYLVSARFEDG